MLGPVARREIANLARVREVHRAGQGDDAEALARMFEDRAIIDDGSVRGRVEALLAATAHHWIPGLRGPLDVPGLCEVKGAGDGGFRAELRDPWPSSTDQIGHFLTAVGLGLNPGVVRQRRILRSLRDIVGAPPGMPDAEVAMRLAIGHEKAPDPGRFDPRMPWLVRRQFVSATDDDVAAFRSALAWAAERTVLDLAEVRRRLAAVQPGEGAGNSAADLVLTFMGFALAQRISAGGFQTAGEVARWVRAHMANDPRS